MKKIIGSVGVDSGQILICDPGYIDSQWEKEEYNDRRRYHHTKSKRTLEFGRDFHRFDSPIIPYDKSMNDMLADGDVEELPNGEPMYEFSYNACCRKTVEGDFGELNFKMGHAGVGVVSRTGYGDGMYPVIADIDKESGRVKSITVVFMQDEDEDYDEDIIFDDSEETE